MAFKEFCSTFCMCRLEKSTQIDHKSDRSIKTHCNIITSLSSQTPLMISLEKRFINFITKSLTSSSSIVSLISKIAIWNPMSKTGCNYRNLLDCDGKLSIVLQNYAHGKKRVMNYSILFPHYMSWLI